MEVVEYRKMAEVEDSMWYYRALHRHLIDALGKARLRPDAAILDAGCGTGGLLRRLTKSRPAWSLSGVDLSPVAIEIARERLPGTVKLSVGSILALPWADASFDAIVSADVVCQVPDPAAAVRELQRCLRPGGVLVLNLPAYQWLYSYHDQAVANLRRYSRREVDELLSAAGFRVEAGTYWNSIPFPLVVLQRKLLAGKEAPSDVRLYPAPLEAIFNGMMLLEAMWLRTVASLPFGCAVRVLARKSA